MTIDPHDTLPLGLNLIHSEYVEPSRAYALPLAGVVLVNAGPITDAEYDARMARWLVRDGLRDVLAWLGWEVGPKPYPGMPRFEVAVDPASVIRIDS